MYIYTPTNRVWELNFSKAKNQTYRFMVNNTYKYYYTLITNKLPRIYVLPIITNKIDFCKDHLVFLYCRKKLVYYKFKTITKRERIPFYILAKWTIWAFWRFQKTITNENTIQPYNTTSKLQFRYKSADFGVPRKRHSGVHAYSYAVWKHETILIIMSEMLVKYASEWCTLHVKEDAVSLQLYLPVEHNVYTSR